MVVISIRGEKELALKACREVESTLKKKGTLSKGPIIKRVEGGEYQCIIEANIGFGEELRPVLISLRKFRNVSDIAIGSVEEKPGKKLRIRISE